MKKLLGIVVLGLLWCNVGVAEINVPNKYLGNCGITKGGLRKDLLDMYLIFAFKFADKYNFNTNIKSDELIYCNLSDSIGIRLEPGGAF